MALAECPGCAGPSLGRANEPSVVSEGFETRELGVNAERAYEEPASPADAVELHLLFREVNERIKDLNVAFHPVLPRGDWVCECADGACVERIEMSLAEYDAIRANPGRFPALPGHELTASERVVARFPGYVVVERTP